LGITLYMDGAAGTQTPTKIFLPTWYVQRRDFVYAVFKNKLTSSRLREARGKYFKIVLH
jgi:hypothetical protein